MKKFLLITVIILIILGLCFGAYSLLTNISLPTLDQDWESNQFENNVRSKYFNVYSNVPLEQTEDYAHISDLFLDYIDTNYFEIEDKDPISILLFRNKYEAEEFLQNELNISETLGYGIYYYAWDTFITYEGTGYGTFTHEIMHALIKENIPLRPEWAEEGLASFFEKFVGYESGGVLYLDLGFQNPWRIEEAGDRLTTMKLEEIVNNTTGTTQKRFLTVFIYKQGVLNRFIGLIDSGEKLGYDTYLEAAFQMELSEIEPLWINYINEIDRNRSDYLKTPPSKVYETKAEYEEAKDNYR